MSHFPAVEFIDGLGAPRSIPYHGDYPSSISLPFLQGIALGQVSGRVPWSKIGFTPTMDTTESDLWGAAGVYQYPSSPQQMEVVSSSASDTGVVIFSGTATGGGTTTLVDSGADFLGGTPVAVGDLVLIDTTGYPEYGYVTGVATTTLTLAAGFSLGGTSSGRAYKVVDVSASTGAQVVRIEYLDSNFAVHDEFVVLNGTTAVATETANALRINRFRAIATGSSLKAEGNISLRALADTPVYSYILAGNTRSRSSIYTVPAGKSLYVYRIETSFATSGSPNKEYARIYTRANVEPGTQFLCHGIFFPYTEIVTQNSTVVNDLTLPTKLPPMTDIRISGIATATGVAMCGLRGWLE